MKQTITIMAIITLSVMVLAYCSGMRISGGGLSVTSEDSSQQSSEGSGESSRAGSTEATSDDSSEDSSAGTSYTTSKPRDEANTGERDKLAAIFDESATTNGARPEMALLAKKYELTEDDVFDTVSRLTAEGKIDSETSLQSNAQAKAALTLIEKELKRKAKGKKK